MCKFGPNEIVLVASVMKVRTLIAEVSVDIAGSLLSVEDGATDDGGAALIVNDAGLHNGIAREAMALCNDSWVSWTRLLS